MVWSRSAMEASFFSVRRLALLHFNPHQDCRLEPSRSSTTAATPLDLMWNRSALFELPGLTIEQGPHKSGPAESTFDRPLALSVECYFLPTKRTLAVKALRSPPESRPKLGASTLFAMTLGFRQSIAFTISMRAAHKYPRKANFFSSAKFRFL